MDYGKLSVAEVEEQLLNEQKAFKKLTKHGLQVDMTRGRPAKAQLDICMPMLEKAASCDFALKAGDVIIKIFGFLSSILTPL